MSCGVSVPRASPSGEPLAGFEEVGRRTTRQATDVLLDKNLRCKVHRKGGVAMPAVGMRSISHSRNRLKPLGGNPAGLFWGSWT